MFLQMIFLVVITIFVGQAADTAALNAVGLGVSLLNVFGYSLCLGLATAIDTLGSQAYGSNQKHMVWRGGERKQQGGSPRAPGA